MDDADRKVCARVKEHIQEAGLTHAVLAEKTGWDEQRVYRVLNGLTRLTAADMEELARILKKPVADLYRSPGRRAS
jgi:transcriptional regulator with XRE-family HTH domain